MAVMNKKAAELLGWYGTVAILGSYALVSMDVIAATSLTYQLLNLTGAVGILVISLRKGVKQSVALNAFWAAIAVVAIVRIIVI